MNYILKGNFNYWKLIAAVITFVVVVLFVILSVLHPLKRARSIVLNHPAEVLSQARHLIILSETAGNNLWEGSSAQLPPLLKAFKPLNIWVVPEKGIVDVQLTSGFYHTGLIITSSTEAIRNMSIVEYPHRRLTQNIYQYKGIIAEK